MGSVSVHSGKIFTAVISIVRAVFNNSFGADKRTPLKSLSNLVLSFSASSVGVKGYRHKCKITFALLCVFIFIDKNYNDISWIHKIKTVCY